jgi:hypothetical protein
VRGNFEKEGAEVSRFALRRAELEYCGNNTRGAGYLYMRQADSLGNPTRHGLGQTQLLINLN